MLPGMGLCQENFICLESDRGEEKKKEFGNRGRWDLS